MFKVETEHGKHMDNVWFYGISAKRYCLYQIKDDKIEVLKHSSHGLGGLIDLSEEDIKQIWSDFLSYHHGTLSKEAIENKYSGKYVMGKLAMTSPLILQRFWHINKDKRIKPFNFVIVGIGHKLDLITKEPIIPMIPYTKNYDVVPYTPFTDYKTGKEYRDNTKSYWKPLSEFLFDYFEHNDNKYEGTLGELTRRHIEVGDIEHIGKESNNLDETEVIGILDKNYVIYDNKKEQKIIEIIKKLTPKQAKAIGISKRNLRYLRKKVKIKNRIILKTKTLNRLLKMK